MTKQVIKTIVVDDEPLARKGLRARLERHDDVQVLAECQNGLEAVSSISQHRPDLVSLPSQGSWRQAAEPAGARASVGDSSG